MHRLTIKLGGAMLLIILIMAGLMAFLTNAINTYQFEQYIQRGNSMHSETLASNLGQYYIDQSGWNAIESMVNDLAYTETDRIIVADDTGSIIADSTGQLVGQSIAENGLTNGTSIIAAGDDVGTLYLLTSGEMGKGSGHGMGINSPQPTTITTVASIGDEYLSQVSRSIWLTTAATAVFALLVGVLLTRQIIRPVHALTLGTHRVADGDLKYRVSVRTKDEIGQLTDSFNKMASTLEAGEKSRRQLSADIAHELRTPLTVIEGTVDGIIDGVFPPDKKYLQSVKDQIGLMTRLISDLRDLTLVESGQFKLEKSEINIVDMLNQLVTQYTGQVAEKNIHLDFDGNKSPVMVSIDPVRIEQVLGNLITNAIRYTPRSGAITIGIENDATNVVITIADSGEGIPAADLPHIFERFYRVDESRVRKAGGTGLGLAIVKQMVEAHGGRASVESHIGIGSKFSITLPIDNRQE